MQQQTDDTQRPQPMPELARVEDLQSYPHLPFARPGSLPSLTIERGARASSGLRVWMEAWLHEQGWLPAHLPLSDVKLSLATVVLFLPAVVFAHWVAKTLAACVRGQSQKRD